MKKHLQIFLIITVFLLALFMTGCSAPPDDAFILDTDRLTEGVYTFATKMVNNDVTVDYDTVYTVKKYVDENGRRMIRIESSGEKNGETIYSKNELLGEESEGRTAMTPVSVYMEYKNSNNSQSDVTVSVKHSISDGRFDIEVQQYPQGSMEIQTSNYTVEAAKQYYDSETLPFIISCLQLEKDLSLNFTLSSSNRDSVQSMVLTVADTATITVGENEIECYAVIIRPNTPFTNYATYMYYSVEDNSLVKIQQDTISFTLKSIDALPAE